MLIRPLRVEDDAARKRFGSGNDALDAFLQKYAKQNHFRHHVGTTHVAIAEASAPLPIGEILGYVTVSPSSIALPENVRGSLPKYPELPVLLVARLATASAARGAGIGRALLAYAFDLAVELSDKLGCVGVITDPKDDQAVAFYGKLGFVTLDVTPSPGCARPPMFVRVDTIRAARTT
jgi:GNAT superfamily N-acetyltransferase